MYIMLNDIFWGFKPMIFRTTVVHYTPGQKKTSYRKKPSEFGARESQNHNIYATKLQVI